MEQFPDAKAIHSRAHDLLTGVEHPRNELEHQVVLAQELFTRDNPSEVMNIDDMGFQNRIMYYWNNNGYAKAFRDLIERPDFKLQYRFSRNPLNVTLSDVEYFLHNNELPER